jgi:uncharacterized protein YbjQ (UPF0145 family)
MTNQSNNQISVRQMAKLLKNFHVGNGDILAVKHGTENANQEAIKQIVAALTQMGVNAMVIVVGDFNDLTVLNEIEMQKRGWYRLEKLTRISSRLQPENKESTSD